MFSRSWLRSSLAPASRRKSRRRRFASPWVQLNAEPLEDRRLMNADDPADSVVALSADATTAADAEASSITSTSDSALPERFASEAEFEQWLLDAAVAQWEHLFGQSTYSPNWGWGGPVFFDGSLVMRAADLPVAFTAAMQDHSDTNVQVEGVDEADLVETDGEFLYMISGQDLVIVKAGVGDELQIVSRTRLAERPQGIYLSGDRLALLSSNANLAGWTGPVRFLPGVGTLAVLGDVDSEQPDGPITTVTVLDISDRSAPSLVHTTELDGQLVTSRVVDGQLRLVVTNQLDLPAPIALPVATVQLPPISPNPSDGSETRVAVADAVFGFWEGPGGGAQHVYETKEQYLARVRDQILELALPQLRSLDLDGEVLSEWALFASTDLYRPPSHSDRSMITLAIFDLANNEAGPEATSNIMGGADPQVYSSVDHVYVFSQQAPASIWDSSADYKTGVWKFSIDGETHAVDLSATGQFEGTLLNQFAADERDGYLRVVTRPGGWGDGGHGVQVLEQTGDTLAVVGSVSGIAADEVLYSVRFVDDRAFFVTFRKVDPLFAVDLSDPANPRLLGELHIPGYSDYLQPLDENHLLAVGRGADEQTGLFEELQVSLFDVSDLTDPQLLHRYSFGGGRSTATPVTGDRWTRGDGDHHALSLFAEQGIFAIPIFTADAGWSRNGEENTTLFEPSDGGLQVFRVDLDLGFTPMGLVEHDALVERSLRIGEHLYAISAGQVTVHELDDPGTQLGEVVIAPAEDEQPLELRMFEPLVVTNPPDESGEDGGETTQSKIEIGIPFVGPVDDTLTVKAFGDAQFLAVLDNDTLTNPLHLLGGTLSLVDVSTSALGAKLSIAPNGRGILYTPQGTFDADDTFTYTLSNGDTATVTVDLVNERVQTTPFTRQLVVPGEIATTILRWHDPDPNVVFAAKMSWQDGAAAPFHLTQVSGPNGTDATVSYWRTPATHGDFNGTLTIEHNGGFAQSYATFFSAHTVILRPDHADATKTELAIGGFDLNDPILFQPDVGGKKLTAPGLVETVAGEPSARLSYHGSNMGAFIADRIVVYGQGGHDLIQVNAGIAIDAWLFGGAGNDILVGGAGSDVLVGGIGEDILYGFGGRDLVFGGLDSDFVHGGGWRGAPVTGNSDSDIVIGSYVSFDFDPAKLNVLFGQWGDENDDYATRVGGLRAGSPRLQPLRTGTTVFDDFSVDHVFGGGDTDWLFVETDRDTFDLQRGESVN
jgi:uncharacterized secreted protein with C-terminal beta-propeller domain